MRRSSRFFPHLQDNKIREGQDEAQWRVQHNTTLVHTNQIDSFQLNQMYCIVDNNGAMVQSSIRAQETDSAESFL